jgi:hypothetical protein
MRLIGVLEMSKKEKAQAEVKAQHAEIEAKRAKKREYDTQWLLKDEQAYIARLHQPVMESDELRDDENYNPSPTLPPPLRLLPVAARIAKYLKALAYSHTWSAEERAALQAYALEGLKA